MSDNIAVTPGTGATFGMDEVVDGTLGTVKVGFGKIMDGTLDSTNKLVVNASGEATVKDTNARTSLASLDTKTPASPATTGKQDTGNTSLASIDTKLPASPATSGKQDTGNTSLASIDGKITAVNTGAVVVASGAITADTELTTADLDTGAGTDTRAVVGLAGSKSGGAALIPGDATKGLAVDLTATGANSTAIKVDGSAATQPVSGTVDTELTTGDLDTGAGTDTRAVVGLVGSKSGGGVLIPGDATAGLKVDLGTDNDVTVTSGAITETNSGAIKTSVELIDDTVATLGTTTYSEATTKGLVAGAVRRDANTTLVDTTNEVAPLQVNATGELKVAQIQALPAGTNAIGKLAANDGVDIGDVTINNASINVTDNSSSLTVDAPVATPVFVRLSDGSAAIATLPVSIAATVTTKETRATTPAQTSVSVTNANTSVLASNANRLGATIYNEGSAVCYLKLGATASTTSYSCQVASGGYYEVPFNYTGAIDGITSASTAQLRITELT